MRHRKDNPLTETFCFKLTKELRTKLNELSLQEDLSTGDYIRRVMERHVAAIEDVKERATAFVVQKQRDQIQAAADAAPTQEVRDMILKAAAEEETRKTTNKPIVREKPVEEYTVPENIDWDSIPDDEEEGS